MFLISIMGRILGGPTLPDKVFLPTLRPCLSRDQAVEPGQKPREFRPVFGAAPNHLALCNVPLAGFQETASLPGNHPGAVIYWPGQLRQWWGDIPRECDVWANAVPG